MLWRELAFLQLMIWFLQIRWRVIRLRSLSWLHSKNMVMHWFTNNRVCFYFHGCIPQSWSFVSLFNLWIIARLRIKLSISAILVGSQMTLIASLSMPAVNSSASIPICPIKSSIMITISFTKGKQLMLRFITFLTLIQIHSVIMLISLLPHFIIHFYTSIHYTLYTYTHDDKK